MQKSQKMHGTQAEKPVEKEITKVKTGQLTLTPSLTLGPELVVGIC